MPTPLETGDLPRWKDRRALLIAAAVSLLLHAGAIFGLGRLAHGQTPGSPVDAIPVELVTEPRADEAPKQFTELPPDRAEAAAKKPELLSNVTSRARDPIAGGETDHPDAPNAEDPSVRLEPGASRPSAASPAAPQAGTPTGSSEPHRSDESALESSKSREPAQPSHAAPGVTGNSDIHQPDYADGVGEPALTGEISLNTTAWNYAPWLEHYKRQVLERWVAPPAYYMGLLRDGGWAEFDVEISRQGKMLRCDRLGQQGHSLLILAADDAIRYVSPIEPLPADFPEPTLILHVRMIYPRIVPRSR